MMISVLEKAIQLSEDGEVKESNEAYVIQSNQGGSSMSVPPFNFDRHCNASTHFR